jgi:hypothetical protein
VNVHFKWNRNKKVLARHTPPFSCRYSKCKKDFPEESLLFVHVKSHRESGESNPAVGESTAAPISNLTVEAILETSVPDSQAKRSNGESQSSGTNTNNVIYNKGTNNDKNPPKIPTATAVKQEPTERDTFPCKSCSEVFSSTNKLDKHKKESHTTVKIKCRYCDNTFSSRKKLQIHFRVHTQAFPFHCKFCPRKFMLKAQLKNHLQRQHLLDQEKKFRCSRSHQRFLYQTGLDKHVLKNKCLLFFSCTFCTERFREKGALESHLLLHDPLKHKCSQCELLFKTSVELRIHKQSHTAPAIKLAYCVLCTMMFPSTTALETHTGLHWRGELPCTCHQCHENFPSVSAFDLHMLIAH